VVLKDDVADVDGEVRRLSRHFGGDRDGGHIYQRALKGFSARMPEQQALRLANDPRVEFVAEDGVISLGAVQTGATWGLDASINAICRSMETMGTEDSSLQTSFVIDDTSCTTQ
jgi:hypothetical protein